jgi:hypothetical protein
MRQTLGRPPIYTANSKVYLCATGQTKLQSGSDRRAIINVLVDNGGSMTLGELDARFGFSVRSRVFALQRSGWVRIEGGTP